MLGAQFGFSFVGFYNVLVFPVTLINGAVIAGAILYSTKHADSIDLELEVDPLNVDHFSCTPLVRNGFTYSPNWFLGWHRDVPSSLCDPSLLYDIYQSSIVINVLWPH